ncbi:hypothetical protein ACR6C2_34950 [Streptomyces sp. INA 01156]
MRDAAGTVRAGLSISLPGTRYDPLDLQFLVSTLQAAARALSADLAGTA